MTDASERAAPIRGNAHEALSVFLGHWHANGISFGGTDQSGLNPKANGVPWKSTHSTRWHTGKFFMVQDERALIDGQPFDTLSIMGVEANNTQFCRTFENHGFYRHYAVSADDRTWVLEGESERARTVFDATGDTQTISWEWLRDGKWLPLCDRIASRIGSGSIEPKPL